MDRTVGEVGEVELLRILQGYVSPDPYLSRDDDAISVQRVGRYQVVNVDGWAESTDRPPGMPLKACGYRAAVNAMSDLICKGADPTDVLVSLYVPRTFRVSELEEVVQGVVEACRLHGANYRGGDLNQLEQFVIDVTCIGTMDERPIPRHSDLEEGDEVWWMGPPLGSTGMLLDCLLGGEDVSDVQEELHRYFYYPVLPRRFTAIAERFRERIICSADSSDGIAHTLALLVEGSGHAIELDAQAVKAPDWVVRRCTEDMLDEHVLYGGEELGVIFVTRGDFQPQEALKIGEVHRSGQGVMFRGKFIQTRGWEHF